MSDTNALPPQQPNTLPLKERMKILRSKMPERDPHVRSRNFEEVNLGAECTQCLLPFKILLSIVHSLPPELRPRLSRLTTP